MRYVMFILVTLALHAQVSMAKSEPAIGLAEGNPSAVNCPSGQYPAGFNVWSAPQISGFSPYCVAMQADGQWQGVPQIHLESALSRRRVNGDYVPDVEVAQQRRQSLDAALRALIDEAVAQLAARFSSPSF